MQKYIKLIIIITLLPFMFSIMVLGFAGSMFISGLKAGVHNFEAFNKWIKK